MVLFIWHGESMDGRRKSLIAVSFSFVFPFLCFLFIFFFFFHPGVPGMVHTFSWCKNSLALESQIAMGQLPYS